MPALTRSAAVGSGHARPRGVWVGALVLALTAGPSAALVSRPAASSTTAMPRHAQLGRRRHLGWRRTAGTTSMKLVGEVEVPHARDSPLSRCLEGVEYKAEWPYSKAQLTPEDAGNDGAFYTIPKFVHHAGEECRSSLTDYYACVLPTTEGSAVLDLCSSWTSHYPESYSPKALGVRCAALGLNFLELLKNPHKTEFKIHDLNTGPKLPYGDSEFDVITNSLSSDYLTSPLEVFTEMNRVLKPGGTASMAFTNRCFPTKVVPIWLSPMDDENHVKIIASYFHYSGGWEDISVADVCPAGWVGMRDPMYVVQARKAR